MLRTIDAKTNYVSFLIYLCMPIYEYRVGVEGEDHKYIASARAARTRNFAEDAQKLTIPVGDALMRQRE